MHELKKRLFVRAMEAEMTNHLGYAKHAPEGATAATAATVTLPGK
jgi:transposase-like protein